MMRRMQTKAKLDVAVLARRQAILCRLEGLLRQRAAVDGSKIWKCPVCRCVMRGDQGQVPRRGEMVCSHCHRNMELQPTGVLENV